MTLAAATPQPPGSPWPMALAGLALAWLAVLVAFWSTWASMANVWWHTTTFHHGFLIAPIALLLAWRLRPAVAAIAPRQEPLALLPLAGCTGAWLLGQASDVQLLQHLAVVGMLMAVAVALLGRAVGRVLLFPLLFLFFMVPFGEGLVPHLQDFTARFAVTLLRLMGVPVFHDGVLIETPSGLFEVAEACAGIRFLIANLVIVVLFAHLAFRRAWKWLLFLALGVLVPIVANGLRAFGIVYIAFLTDNAYAAGIDHVVYGWGFFTVVMLLLLLIGRLLADDDALLGTPAPAPAIAAPAPTGAHGRRWRPAFALLVVALAAAGPTYAALAMRPPATAVSTSLALPAGNAAWRSVPEAGPSPWRPIVVGADREATQVYDRLEDGRQVDLFVAFYTFQRQGAEVVHQGNRLADGESWIRTAGGRMALDAPGLPPEARFERLAGAGGRAQRLVLWWYWVDGAFTADPLHAKLLQVRGRLLGRTRPAAILAVSTAVDESAAMAAKSAIESFLGPSGPAPAAYLVALGETRR